MMGKSEKQKQLTFTSLENLSQWEGLPIVPEDSIYAALGRDEEVFRDELFADAYAQVGHPSKSPAFLCKVMVLQFLDNCSDREAEDRARYDLRWKRALGIGLGEAGFDYSTLSKFRTRLLLFRKERTVFAAILEKAKAHGFLTGEQVTQIMDSTFTIGAAAVQDTYRLIRNAIRKLLHSLNRRTNPEDRQLFTGLKLDYQDRKKPDIDWDNAEAREALLNDLVADAQKVLALTATLRLTEIEQKLRDTLVRVTYQDIEPRAEGDGVVIKKGVAKDRIISTVDPEMRHGRKSASRTFNGYKTHIAMEQESEFISAVEVTPGNVHDGEVAKDLIDQQPEELKPDKMIGDTCYGTGPVRKDMAERHIEVLAPVAEGRNAGGLFKKADFQIDLKAETCFCPAGQKAVKIRRDHKTQELKAFDFAPAQCQNCPLKDQCISNKKGYRSIPVHPYERYLQEGRKQQETPAFKAEYRQHRPAVERKQAEMVRHGVRKARYFGLAKVRLQMFFVTAAVNYKLFVKKLQEQAAALKNQVTSPGISVAT